MVKNKDLKNISKNSFKLYLQILSAVGMMSEYFLLFKYQKHECLFYLRSKFNQVTDCPHYTHIFVLKTPM